MNIGSWLTETAMHGAERKAASSAEKAESQLQAAFAAPSADGLRAACATASHAAAEAAHAGDEILKFVDGQQKRANGTLAAAEMTQLRQAVAEMRQQAMRAAQSASMASSEQRPDGVVFYTQQVAAAFRAAFAALAQAQQIVPAIQAQVAQYEEAQRQAQEQQKQVQAQEQEAQRQIALAAKQRQQYLAQYGGIDPDEVMREIQAGTYPAVPCGVVLKKGELALFTAQVQLAEDKTSTSYVGGSRGVSVPIAYGIRFRVGSYHGHPVTRQSLNTVDHGTLVVTTQRLVFNGARQSIVIQANKILNTIIYHDGVDVRVENKRKREVFLVANPQLLNTYVLLASQLATK